MRTGQTIGNRKTGEILTMLVSGDETRGMRELYQVRLPPWRHSPPLHYHVAFTETFSVLEGSLDLYLGNDRKRIVLQPGESRTVAGGQLHTFANETDQTALITVETLPAGGVAKAFELAYGVANEGGDAKDGLPKNPLVRLIFIQVSGGYVPNVPLLLQKCIFAAARLIARMTGFEKRLAAYLAAP